MSNLITCSTGKAAPVINALSDRARSVLQGAVGHLIVRPERMQVAAIADGEAAKELVAHNLIAPLGQQEKVRAGSYYIPRVVACAAMELGMAAEVRI